MTIQEAIMIIQSIPEKIWNQMSETENEAIETVVKASEKQISKKPIMRHIKSFDGYNDGRCPCCGSYVQEIEYDKKYCQSCGQKLDWSEE